MWRRAARGCAVLSAGKSERPEGGSGAALFDGAVGGDGGLLEHIDGGEAGDGAAEVECFSLELAEGREGLADVWGGEPAEEIGGGSGEAGCGSAGIETGGDIDVEAVGIGAGEGGEVGCGGRRCH